jgi:hypothetical protein
LGRTPPVRARASTADACPSAWPPCPSRGPNSLDACLAPPVPSVVDARASLLLRSPPLPLPWLRAASPRTNAAAVAITAASRAPAAAVGHAAVPIASSHRMPNHHYLRCLHLPASLKYLCHHLFSSPEDAPAMADRPTPRPPSIHRLRLPSTELTAPSRF